MEIDLIGGKKLKVSLTAQDLDDSPVNLASLDRSDRDTKEFLIGILEEGKARTGFSPKGAKLFVEIYPDNSGGAVLYFTAFHSVASSPGGYELSRVPPVVFAFEDADQLCQGADHLFRQHGQRVLRSSLYRFRQAFRLILYPLDYSDGLSVAFLGEYARKVGEGYILAAYIDEHGEEIIADTAIEVISQFFAD